MGSGIICFLITLVSFTFDPKVFAGPVFEGQYSQRLVSNAPLGCSYRDGRYGHGEPVETPEPCLNCTCTRGVLVCYLRVCPTLIPPSSSCFAVKKFQDCCATMICKSFDDKKSNDSVVIKSHFSDRTMVDSNVPIYKKAEDIEVSTSYIVQTSTKMTSSVDDIITKSATKPPSREKGGKYLASDSMLFVTSTPNVGTTDLNHLNAISGGCYVNGTLYGEGSAMMSSSFCEYCYCIRGKQMCIRPKCHLSIEGCSPRFFSHYTCCPTRYMCSERNKIHKLTSAAPSTTTTTTPAIPAQTVCKVDGLSYSIGDPVPSTVHCQTCYCSNEGVVCTSVTCSPAMEGCEPIIPEGHCCPLEYKCNFTQTPPVETETNVEFTSEITSTVYTTASHSEELMTTLTSGNYTKEKNRTNEMLQIPKPDTFQVLDNMDIDSYSLPIMRENDRVIYFHDFAENIRQRISEITNQNKKSVKKPISSFLQFPFLFKDHNERGEQVSKHASSMLPRQVVEQERSHFEYDGNINSSLPETQTSVLLKSNSYSQILNSNISKFETSSSPYPINDNLTLNNDNFPLNNTEYLSHTITSFPILQLDYSYNGTDSALESINDFGNITNITINYSEILGTTENSREDKTTVDFTNKDIENIPDNNLTYVTQAFEENVTNSDSTFSLNDSESNKENSSSEENKNKAKNIWYSEPDLTTVTEVYENDTVSPSYSKLDNKKRPRQQNGKGHVIIPFLAQDAITRNPYSQHINLRNNTHKTSPSPTIEIITGHCFINNKIYINGEMIEKSDPCLLCRCFYGKELCQQQKCSNPPSSNCLVEYLPEFCCPRYNCGEDITALPGSSTHALLPNTFSLPESNRWDVVIAEKLKSATHTITEDSTEYTQSETNLPTVSSFTDVQNASLINTTEMMTKVTTSDLTTLGIQDEIDEEKFITTTITTPTTEELENVKLSDDSRSDFWSLLKVSGCNIYGKYYQLNEKVLELGSECKVCICTQDGVQCTDIC